MIFGLIYHGLTLWLYSATCFAASGFYEAVRREFQLWIDLPKNLQKTNQLRSIKSHHIVACEAVDAINYCFGWPLLFTSSFLVVSEITYVFYVVSHGVQVLNHITLLIHSVTHVIILCYSSDNIRNKVFHVIQSFITSITQPFIG